MIDTTTPKGHDMTAVDTTAISAALGYDFQVYEGEQARYTKLAYVATGPRGAQLGLVRYPNLPDTMYVMNLHTWNVNAAIHGNRYFTDKDGTLTTLNY